MKSTKAVDIIRSHLDALINSNMVVRMFKTKMPTTNWMSYVITVDYVRRGHLKSWTSQKL